MDNEAFLLLSRPPSFSLADGLFAVALAGLRPNKQTNLPTNQMQSSQQWTTVFLTPTAVYLYIPILRSIYSEDQIGVFLVKSCVQRPRRDQAWHTLINEYVPEKIT